MDLYTCNMYNSGFYRVDQVLQYPNKLTSIGITEDKSFGWLADGLYEWSHLGRTKCTVKTNTTMLHKYTKAGNHELKMIDLP